MKPLDPYICQWPLDHSYVSKKITIRIILCRIRFKSLIYRKDRSIYLHNIVTVIDKRVNIILYKYKGLTYKYVTKHFKKITPNVLNFYFVHLRYWTYETWHFEVTELIKIYVNITKLVKNTTFMLLNLSKNMRTSHYS